MTPTLAAAGMEDLPGTLLLLAAVLLSAKVAGFVAERVRVPAVLGELGAGVVLGLAARFEAPGIPDVAGNPYVTFLAEVGVILLLFEVGLENTVSRIATVGFPALRVAALGVVVPFGLGWGVVALLLPSAPPVLGPFLGAALSATSLGTTARVLKETGSAETTEGRTILGAVVLDDIPALVSLAVIVRLAAGGEGDAVKTAILAIGEAVVFLAVGIGAGLFLSKPLYRLAASLRVSGMLLALSLALCFSFSWAAHAAGLSPIVGAFAAGLVLEPSHSRIFRGQREQHSLEHLLHPLSSLLVPVFFVHVGSRLDAREFADPGVLGLGVALTIAAVAGKLASGLGVAPGTDRWIVGLGMVPRGEVGLVFVSVGAGLIIDGAPLLDGRAGSAVVFMVAATTLLGPLLLGVRLRRKPVPPQAVP